MIMELYNSGILTARFDPAAMQNGIQLLQLETAQLGEAEIPDEALLQQLTELSGIDFYALPKKLAEAAPYVEKACAEFTLSDGSVYNRKGEHGYIQRHSTCAVDLLTDNGVIVGAQHAHRDAVSILIAPDYQQLTVLPQWKKLYPKGIHPVKHLGTEMIPMRDGVRLSTKIWLPADVTEAVPCVLIRSPYGKLLGVNEAMRLAQRGYAVALQDVRGRHSSEGSFEPLTAETEDGSDTIDYIAAQPWCSGRVGMIGASYLGYVQWAAAASRNPHLKALVSEVCAGSAFVDLPKRGGTMESGVLAWTFLVGNRYTEESRMIRDDWDKVLARRPLDDVCRSAYGEDIPFWRHWIEHDTEDDYWMRGNWYVRALENGGVDVPCLIQTGWFDDDGMGSTQALDLTADYPKGQRKVIIGPWIHEGNSAYDLHGVALGDHALRYDLDLHYYMWFERHLRGREDMPEDTAAVEYYTLWENAWKHADAWPPENTQAQQLWLDGDTLRFSPPQTDTVRSFCYDPENPAVHLVDVSENELEVPEDYTQEEKRSDYLCFTTEPFTDDIVFTGDANVKLYLSSDAPDTDLFVRLTKVFPDGRSVKFADSLLDVKFREGFDRKVYMKRGEVYEINLRTMKFSALFRKGERLRLSVTSSGVNLIFPNSNTEDGFNSVMRRKANNTIHCGAQYPSAVTIRIEHQR